MPVPPGYEPAFGVKQDDWVLVDGVWYAPAGTAPPPPGFNPGPGAAEPAPSAEPTPSEPFESPGGVPVQPGLDIILAEMEAALVLAQIEASENIARVQASATRAAAGISASAQKQIAAMNADLQRELQEKEAELALRLQNNAISNDQFLQERELIQQESQFARSLAQREIEEERDYELRVVQEDHAYELGQAELELGRVAEMRAERELMAELAANPSDFVKAEFYKRSLGTPTVLDNLAQEFADGEQNLLGQPYPAAPPAYSDETIQQVGQAAFGQEGARTLYNPNLGGTGAFGVTIPGVQDISRAEFLGLDETELALASSFLRAGTEQDGDRVAINPADYFRDLERSFIPVLEGAGTRTQYT